jgi:YbbR domain-containing protein
MGAIETITRTTRELVVQNFGLKVVSLMFALGYYGFIHGAHDAQRSFALSVVVLPPHDIGSRVLLTQPPTTVRFTVSGSKTIVDDLKAEDLGTVQLDLRGESTYASFDTRAVTLPPGLNHTVDPPGIELEWDDLIDRELPIQVSVTGQPAPGYAVQAQIASPTMVVAHGPRTLVEAIQLARAEPFDISGLGEGIFPRKIMLDRAPSQVRFDVQHTLVTVQIDRAKLDKVFSKVPVRVVGLAHATVTPGEVDVRVSGPVEVVSPMRMEQVVPTASILPTAIDTTKPGSVTLPVEVIVDGCTTKTSPDTVLVKW